MLYLALVVLYALLYARIVDVFLGLRKLTYLDGRCIVSKLTHFIIVICDF